MSSPAQAQVAALWYAKAGQAESRAKLPEWARFMASCGRLLTRARPSITVGLSVVLHGATAAPGAKAYGRWFTEHPQRPELMEHRHHDD